MSSHYPIDWNTRDATFPVQCDSDRVASVFGSPALRRSIFDYVHFPDARQIEEDSMFDLRSLLAFHWLYDKNREITDQQHAMFTRILHEFGQVTPHNSLVLDDLSRKLQHHHVHPVTLDTIQIRRLEGLDHEGLDHEGLDHEAFVRLYAEWKRHVDNAFARAAEVTLFSLTTICRDFERDLPSYFDHPIELVNCTERPMPLRLLRRWSTIPSINVDFHSLAMLDPEERYSGNRSWASGVQQVSLVGLVDRQRLMTVHEKKESLFHSLALDTLHGFEQLRHLDVGYLGVLSDTSLLQIGKLTHLKTLCICSDAPSLNQLVSLQQLQRLCITFVPNDNPTTVPSLTPLGQHLHRLEILALNCGPLYHTPRPDLGDLSQLKRLKQVIYDDDEYCPRTIAPLSPLQSLLTLPSTDVEIRVMRIHLFQSRGMYLYPTRAEDCELMMNLAAKFPGTSLRRTKDLLGWTMFRRPAVPHRPPSFVPSFVPLNLPEEIKRMMYPYLLPRKAFDKCLHQLMEQFVSSFYSYGGDPRSNYRDVLRKVYTERDVTCPARVQWTIRKLYGYDLCAQCSDNGSWNRWCCPQCRDTFRR